MSKIICNKKLLGENKNEQQSITKRKWYYIFRKIKKIKENGYEIVPREQIEETINYSRYKFMIESYCKRCGEIYLREIYDYEINEQNKNCHEFQIKIGKYISQKYYWKILLWKMP